MYLSFELENGEVKKKEMKIIRGEELGIGDINIIVDDNGLFKKDNHILKVTYGGNVIGHFAGNIMFEGDENELAKIEVTLSNYIP